MEIFDDQQLTCAIWDRPFNTLIKVTNASNGKSVVVRVNDRGPARRLVREGRIIDLSKAAFAQIADLDKGLIHIELAIVSSE
jgi:rare lipoprotein A